MLWTTDGALSGIEVAWTGDTVPAELPEARDLVVFRWREVPGKSYRVPQPLSEDG
jgi:hypothetical protein